MSQSLRQLIATTIGEPTDSDHQILSRATAFYSATLVGLLDTTLDLFASEFTRILTRGDFFSSSINEVR